MVTKLEQTNKMPTLYQNTSLAWENNQIYVAFHFYWGYESQDLDLIKEVFVHKLWAQLCPARGPVDPAAFCCYSLHFTGVFGVQVRSCSFIQPAERPAAIISPPTTSWLPQASPYTHTDKHLTETHTFPIRHQLSALFKSPVSGL